MHQGFSAWGNESRLLMVEDYESLSSILKCAEHFCLPLQHLVAQIIEGKHRVLRKHHHLLPLLWWLSVTVTNMGKTLAKWIFSPSCCGCSCSYVDRHVFFWGCVRILSKIHCICKKCLGIGWKVKKWCGGEENNCSKERVTIYKFSCWFSGLLYK